ncbi:hypothetical protein EYF80_011277 [Liparis tanakae]|uniref:Uncharacterized protein n=1 Tax=Liparis tanakae TaxID=230148 RepID=A0A4Z2IM01_9TELE|nr:hypothetical protein EYF80_011277 [Liparis tanakae]
MCRMPKLESAHLGHLCNCLLDVHICAPAFYPAFLGGKGAQPGARRTLAAGRLRLVQAAVVAALQRSLLVRVLGLAHHREGHSAKRLQEKPKRPGDEPGASDPRVGMVEEETASTDEMRSTISRCRAV